MDFTTPRPKKSKKNKIKPAKILIAYEGAVSEKEYFEELRCKIPRQFISLIDFIPVAKTDSSRSSPSQVLEDLFNSEHYNQKAISKRIDHAFIVIDKDHHFDDTHARESVQALKMCRQKSISVVCSTPSFDLWRLLHCCDVISCSAQEKLTMLRNRNRYLKTLCTRCGIDADFSYFEHTRDSILNAEKLNSACENSNIPNDDLFTNMTSIFKLFEELNVDIFRYV